MLSEAARTYDRSKKIKPFSKKLREKIYKATKIQVQNKVGTPLFSPFNTVSRDSRTSYLLRVTNEPNTHTNYNVNPQVLLKKDRRSTIDQASFQRIIGDVKKDDYSIDKSSINKLRCLKSQTLSPQKRISHTARDHQNWRKTYQNFDFKKQGSTQRVKQFPKLSFEQSTNASFMNTLKNTIQSNFNNFDRFKFEPSQHKSHSFMSNSGHQYLKQIQDRQKSPQYDILKAKEQFVRKSLRKPYGEPRFALYKEKIATRFDRNDPDWHTMLEYESKQFKEVKSIDMNLLTDRQPNDIHSKYPIRLALQKITKLKDE